MSDQGQETSNRNDILDVLIIGAGISGIDAAYRIQSECPNKTYAIFEARANLGGTWDLFRYPGIRSDSDIETLGFPFKPWTKKKSIADGASIREYIEETACEFGIEPKIQFNHQVQEARWISQESVWQVKATRPDSSEVVVRTRFLYSCTGYYSYSEAYQPHWPGQETYQGEWIHPQFWPQSFDPSNKQIVVIGSGATAITLIPSLAKAAKQVTMLQRSPSYVASMPSISPTTKVIKSVLPSSLAHHVVRSVNIALGTFVYQLSKRRPQLMRKILMKKAKKELPPSVDVSKDFNPRYNPWDQRLCLAPDGDFFKTLRSGKAKVKTDEIDHFEKSGIRLRSGEFLEADTVISATGLKLQLVGGMKLYKDDIEIDLSQHLNYKGVLMSDVPNFAVALGYTNASWTLKCDLSAQYVSRLLKYMDAHHYKAAWPSVQSKSVRSEPLVDLSSNYIKRSESLLPKQGSRAPWRLHQNYYLDWLLLSVRPIKDRSMIFKRDEVRER